jgi:hypothetical protein
MAHCRTDDLWKASADRDRVWAHQTAGIGAPIAYGAPPIAQRLDQSNPADWIRHHVVAGEVIPSHRLIRRFDSLFPAP